MINDVLCVTFCLFTLIFLVYVHFYVFHKLIKHDLCVCFYTYIYFTICIYIYIYAQVFTFIGMNNDNIKQNYPV